MTNNMKIPTGYDLNPGDIVLCYDPHMWTKVGRDYFDNSWAFQPAEIMAIEFNFKRQEYLVDVKFLHDKRQSIRHFLTSIRIMEQATT